MFRRLLFTLVFPLVVLTPRVQAEPDSIVITHSAAAAVFGFGTLQVAGKARMANEAFAAVTVACGKFKATTLTDKQGNFAISMPLDGTQFRASLAGVLSGKTGPSVEGEAVLVSPK